MWTAYLFQVTTGQLGPRLNFEKATWSVSLNETESLKIDLRRSDLPDVNLNYWLAPWWAGVVYMWNGKPIVAGPIIGEPSQSFDYIHVQCAGIRAVLAKRLMINERVNWNDGSLAQDSIWWGGVSLGTIAQRVVKMAMKKPGGALPISFPLPEEHTTSSIPAGLPPCINEDGSGQDACYWDGKTMGNKKGLSYAMINGKQVFETASHERLFESFNIQNLFVDDILTGLSNESRGPDIMFKPKLIADDQLTFEMWHGTSGNPRIEQRYTPGWDATATNGEVTDLDVIRTGGYQTDRVFSTGGGQDKGTLIQVAWDLSNVARGYPLLESSVAHSESTQPQVVFNHALGSLEANKKALMEFQLGVRGDGAYPLGSFWSGDQVELKLKDILGIKDGTYKMRLLNMNGSTKTDVRLSLQIED